MPNLLLSQSGAVDSRERVEPPYIEPLDMLLWDLLKLKRTCESVRINAGKRKPRLVRASILTSVADVL